METVWIQGDQLHRRITPLAERKPGDVRVLLVESRQAIASRRWHRQRLHLVLAAMRRFAHELEQEGFEVDHRRAACFAAGLREHRDRYKPERVVAMEPSSWSAWQRLEAQGVALVRSNRFLCHQDEFAAWAGGRDGLRMEDFYRWQRRRLGVLMDDDEPAGGRWNYDRENREPPPRGEFDWPEPQRSRLDELDGEVLEDLPAKAFGDPPDGTWATTRRAALARLRHFIDALLPRFGPHQDAMTEGSWSLAHSLLSPYLNLGLLHPEEVVRAAETAFREGRAPIASVEGFVRQIVGWREYVWGSYWLYMPAFRKANALSAKRKLPPAFEAPERTRMHCLREALDAVEAHGYAHHIQRLMVFGNLSLIAEVRPQALLDWMRASFVDAADWVMVPNVLGMALHADGGRMMTKPYAAGGAYLNRMSDHCAKCPYDPKQRTGEQACPFTSLYWRFVDRQRERLSVNARTVRSVRQLDRLRDRDGTLARAAELVDALGRGDV